MSLRKVIATVQQNSRKISISSDQVATISEDISEASSREQESAGLVLQAIESLQQISETVSRHVEETKLEFRVSC